MTIIFNDFICLTLQSYILLQYPPNFWDILRSLVINGHIKTTQKFK